MSCPFYGHYTGQPALAGTHGKETGDFVGVKFYCTHAIADGGGDGGGGH